HLLLLQSLILVSRSLFLFLTHSTTSHIDTLPLHDALPILNQYRLLVEAMLRPERGAEALEGLRYMIYYGHVSFDMKLTFVTETRSEEHTSELQSRENLVCRLLLEKKK